MSEISDELLPLGNGVILAAKHAAGLLAFSKPAGIMAHPNRPSDQKNSLLLARYDLDRECYYLPDANGKLAPLFLLNRLDSPTSGVILAAKNHEIAGVIRAAFKKNLVKKTYLALVRGGRVIPERGFWRDALKKTRAGGTVRSAVGIGGIPAVSEFRWVRADKKGEISLLELLPRTGRTHQLRVQCAAHGFPILGDKTYGDFAFNRRMAMRGIPDRLFLHAAQVAVSFQWKNVAENFSVETELPGEFLVF